MSNPKIEIKTSDKGRITDIYIDGHKLRGVRSFRLEQHAVGAPILTLDLNAFDMSVDSICVLKHEGFSSNMEITFKADEYVTPE